MKYVKRRKNSTRMQTLDLYDLVSHENLVSIENKD